MNLRQLEILRSIVRHRTTIAAAQDLALSQPAVSNALKAMEQQLGFALFERINNRLFPTSEAMVLFHESEEIFALHSRLQGRLKSLSENKTGRLSIMATPPLLHSIVIPTLSDFLIRRPSIHVNFDVQRYEDVVEGILNRVAELGFALAAEDYPGITHEILHSAKMVCALPPGHPLAEREVITPADLVCQSFIGLERDTILGRAVRQSFAHENIEYLPNVEVRYCNTACLLVSAGVGLAVVDPFSPFQGGKDYVITRPFRPVTPATSYILWSNAQPLSRLARSFLSEVKKHPPHIHA